MRVGQVMNSKKVRYNIINILILLLAFLCLGNTLLNNKEIFTSIYYSEKKIVILILVEVTIFLIIHILKLLRFYLILLEEKLNFRRFIRIYIKTTFVNIVLPLKSGEIFRIYCYSNETNNYKIGLLSVLIERFLDICALLVFVLPVEMFFYGRLSFITLFLLMLLLLAVIVYRTFYSIYKYMNRFFILNVASKKSLKVLETLEKQNEWYSYTKNLIEGRFLIVFFLSFIAWSLEYIFVYLVVIEVGEKFVVETFNNYIYAVFLGRSNNIASVYTVIGVVVFGIITMVTYVKSLKNRREG